MAKIGDILKWLEEKLKKAGIPEERWSTNEHIVSERIVSKLIAWLDDEAAPHTRVFHVITDQSRLPRTERARWPASLPWSVVEPWRARAERNHDQTLERLDERGGLSPRELWLAAHDLPLSALSRISEHDAGEWLIGIAAAGAPEAVR